MMLLSLKAAAQELGGVSLPTLRRRIRSGELPVVRLGRRVLIARDALEAFVKGRTKDQPGPRRGGSTTVAGREAARKGAPPYEPAPRATPRREVEPEDAA